MAQHQRENMRDHLAAIQEILAALASNNFADVERAAARIGYSEQMAQMCDHMGAGAVGFTEMALQFHHTADTIATAAKKGDANAALKAVGTTLQSCVGCHAVYRQQVVDATAWEKIMKRRRTTPSTQ
jgi:mono/diheme cytochrome c family protein